jgi:hypothetical protein
MRKAFYIGFIALFSCSGETQTVRPGDLIPTEKMIPLIVDLQVLESYYEKAYVIPAQFRDQLDSSSMLLFEDYGVTKDQFDRSYSFYATDAVTIYALYEAALDSINFRINQPH